MKTTGIVVSMILLSLMISQMHAGDYLRGDTLYENHGCISCHGYEAKKPVSNVVPKLAGKPADELFVNVKKFLAGDAENKESQMAHAIYTPSQCDNPPTDEELRAITAWLSKK